MNKLVIILLLCISFVKAQQDSVIYSIETKPLIYKNSPEYSITSFTLPGLAIPTYEDTVYIKVLWLAKIPYSKQDTVYMDRIYEIGLREDGIVIWRRK